MFTFHPDTYDSNYAPGDEASAIETLDDLTGTLIFRLAYPDLLVWIFQSNTFLWVSTNRANSEAFLYDTGRIYCTDGGRTYCESSSS